MFSGFAPFAYRHKGELVGSEVDLLRTFADLEGWTLRLTVQPFEGLWDRVGDDEFDLAAAGLSKLAARDAIWSEPHAEVRRSLLIPDTHKSLLRDYAAMRRVAVVPGSAAHAHALKHHPSRGGILTVPTLREGIELLESGAVDAVGTGSVSASHHVRTRPGLASVDVHRPNERVEEIAFAVRNSPLLLHKINQFILERKTPQI